MIDCLNSEPAQTCIADARDWVQWMIELSVETFPNVAIVFPKHWTRILDVRGSPPWSPLTLEALVGDHRVMERLVVLVHHSLVVTFADDLAEGVSGTSFFNLPDLPGITPTEVIH